MIAGLWGLLVLGLIVGAFAIANTLTMNVLEQTRELALLRVVAMTRWQVRKTILAQAIIIGVIGLTTGIGRRDHRRLRDEPQLRCRCWATPRPSPCTRRCCWSASASAWR